MTEFLKKLLHDYGLLSVSISTIDLARTKWSHELGPVLSEEALAKIPIAEDEPVIMVRISKSQEMEILDKEDHGIQLIDKETGHPVGDLSVWELPEDEFYFFRAFRAGIAKLTSELPEFFYGMCLVHAFSLFEHYLSELLQSMLLSRPEMLGTTKHVTYGTILEHYPSMDSLLANLAQREVRELFINLGTTYLTF